MPHEFAHDALEMVEYGRDPSILVLADSSAGLERGLRTAGLAKCRVSAAVSFDEALARIESQAGVDAVYVDAERDHGVPFDRLLDGLQSGARSGRFGCVVSAPLELIDQIAARLTHERTIHLCEPMELDRVAALALAASAPPAGLHDVRKQQAPERLQQLSEEVGRIATILASLSEEEAGAQPASPEGAEEGPALTASMVRGIIRARRLRDQYFNAQLFADPAWDMLLDLLAARLEQRRVAVSSLCIAAAVPATTALRWIKTLTDHGLFVRAADPQDGRRVYIELSEQAAARMEAYLRAATRTLPLGL